MNDKCNLLENICHIQCTQKAMDTLHMPKSDLCLRERQLLMLLLTDSHFCEDSRCEEELYCQACSKLLAKVSINSLVARGYLVYEAGYEPISLSTIMPSTVTSSTVTPINKIETKDDTEAVLRFVAGNF